VKLSLHRLAATRQVATTVTCKTDAPQLLKLEGTTLNPIIPGELLTVGNTIELALGLQQSSINEEVSIK